MENPRDHKAHEGITSDIENSASKSLGVERRLPEIIDDPVGEALMKSKEFPVSLLRGSLQSEHGILIK